MSKNPDGLSKYLPILVIMAFITLIDGIDGSMVNIALPTMAGNFGTDTGTISWVTITYFMMLAGTILLFARIASTGLIKKILIFGLILFTIGSLMCGLSTNLTFLIISRIVQGIGAAMMGAAAPMLCIKYLPMSKLATGLGIITLGSALGYALGPVLGGFIIDALSWHWMFFINVPIAAVMLPVICRCIPKDEPEKRHLDICGAVFFFAAIAFGVYALERYSYEKIEITLCMAVACMACLMSFILIELRNKEPILNVRVFKGLEFNLVFVAFFIVNLSYMGILYLIPFYLDINLGLSSSMSGVYLLVPSIATLVLIIPLSELSDKYGKRPFSILGCGVLTIAFAIWATYVPQCDKPMLLIGLALMGLVWALAGGAMGSRLVEKIKDESKEIGGSLMSASVYISGTLGTALYAMMFTSYTGTGDVDFIDLPPETFLTGFAFTLIVSVALMVVATIMSAVVKDGPAVR